MSEYIKKEDLLKEIAKIGGNPWSEWETAGVFYLVNRQPTYTRYDLIPHGRWENQDSSYTRFRCSNCKCNNFSGRWKYCPACGAKMDG